MVHIAMLYRLLLYLSSPIRVVRQAQPSCSNGLQRMDGLSDFSLVPHTAIESTAMCISWKTTYAVVSSSDLERVCGPCCIIASTAQPGNLDGIVYTPVGVAEPKDATPARLAELKALPENTVRYCHTCGRLMAPSDAKLHSEHAVSSPLTRRQLVQPTHVLRPLNVDKTHAQYLFAGETLSHIVNELNRLELRRVLCVGTPRYETHW